jgi:hypothetical protein
VSPLGCVLAVTVLLVVDTLPLPSMARTANTYDVPGSSCRTQAPWTGGGGNVPGVTVDHALGVGTLSTSTS